MSYGPHTRNPWEEDQSEPDEDEHTFACACGDPGCHGDDRDSHNIQLGKSWYASDCENGNRLWQIAQGRQWDAVNDERRGK